MLEEKYVELFILYKKVNQLIIASEKKSGENRLSLPAIAEMRAAFDHLMRVFGVVYAGVTDAYQKAELSADDYCRMNLEKGMNHIYRAGYDAYDIISMATIDAIERIIQSLSPTTLAQVFSDYTTEVRQPLDAAISACDEAKAAKDIEGNNQMQRYFAEYEAAIDELMLVEARLSGKLSELQSVEDERNNAYRSQRNLAIWLAIFGAILGVLSGTAIAVFL